MPTGSRRSRANSKPSPTCCGNSCCARRRTSSKVLASARSAKPSTRSAPPTSCEGCRWSSSAACSICSPLGRRDAGRALRERSGQGAVRLRRHRRQLRQPLRRGLRLCDAAPRLRRGERQEGRLGPRHRRHGRDHAGDGARGARPWRRDRDRCRRARGDRRARPRGRRHPRQWRDHPRQICRLQRQSEIAVHAAGAVGRAAAGISRSHHPLAQRLRHLPDECRAERPALVHRAARRRRSSHRRHHPRAEPRLYGSRLAGRAHAWLEPRARGRGADPLDAGRHARARRASMSRACSASTSRRNCRTAHPGTTIARRSPIS